MTVAATPDVPTTTTTPTESVKSENLSSEDLVDRIIARKWTNTLHPKEEVAAASDDVQPVTDTTTPPEAPKVSWRTATLDDIDNEFFKGKPAEELYKSYKASVDQMNKANEKANRADERAKQLQQQLEQVQRQKEISQQVQQTVTSLLPAQPPPQPTIDPRDQRIRELWFDDPAEAHRLMDEKFNERLTRERDDLLRKAEEVADRKYRDNRAVEEAQYRQTNAYDAAAKAAAVVAEQYGIDQALAESRIASTYALLNQEAETNPNVWLYPNSYLNIITRLYGEPAARQGSETPASAQAPTLAPTPTPAPIIVTQPAPPAQPPGQTRPSPAVTPSAQPSPISEEQRRAREVVASIVGIDPKGLIAREERRMAERKGKR